MENEELIYKYFLDELTAHERQQFEFRLHENADFKAEYDFQENLRIAIKNTERDKLKERLQDVEKQHTAPPKSSWTLWRVAASIAILLGIAGLGFFIGTRANTQKLYAQNYEVYPNTAFNITRGEGAASKKRDAFTAYEAHEYDKAIPAFKALDLMDQNPVMIFYLGQSQLAANLPKQALDTFDKVIRANAEFKSEAQWYSALAALKIKDKLKATQLLTALVDTKGYKSEQAASILKKLR